MKTLWFGFALAVVACILNDFDVMFTTKIFCSLAALIAIVIGAFSIAS